MSRTIPRAYVTAAWSKNRVDAEDEARKYCRELVSAGYVPLCPILAFSGSISEDELLEVGEEEEVIDFGFSEEEPAGETTSTYTNVYTYVVYK